MSNAPDVLRDILERDLSGQTIKLSSNSHLKGRVSRLLWDVKNDKRTINHIAKSNPERKGYT